MRFRSFAIIVALDRALAGDGLQIAEFCETHHLSRRSIYRYLAFLRSLGLETVIDSDADQHSSTLRYADSEGLFTPLAEALVEEHSPGPR